MEAYRHSPILFVSYYYYNQSVVDDIHPPQSIDFHQFDGHYDRRLFAPTTMSNTLSELVIIIVKTISGMIVCYFYIFISDGGRAPFCSPTEGTSSRVGSNKYVQ